LILIKYERRCQRKIGMALLPVIDAIGNIAVMVAALGVWGRPLFPNSGTKILRQALSEWPLTKNAHPAMGCCKDQCTVGGINEDAF
jgi:hypothetical protein